MTRYIAAALLVVAACIEMVNVVRLALSGRADAAAVAAIACTLYWISALLFTASAVRRAGRHRQAQARSSEERATAS
jgi:hypothetical protein